MSEVVNAPVSAPTAPSVDSPTTNVVSSGDTAAVTFDDLTQSKPKAKETPTPKAKGDETSAKAEKDGQKPDSKGDKGKKDDGGEKEAKAKLEADNAQKDAETKARKLLKAKLQDKEMDLDPDLVIPHSVDGKVEEIPLKDLLSNYSGKVAWDKRFSHLDKERRDFTSMKTMAEEKIKAVIESKDPEERFFKMAEFSGQDPVQIRRKFLTENMNLLEKWYGMSDDERKADELEFENKYLRHQAERERSQREGWQKSQELSQKVTQLSSQYGIEKESFSERMEVLEALRKEGKLDKDVTPEFAAETLVKDQMWSKAEEALEENGVTLPPEVKSARLMDLVEIAYQQKIAPADIPDLVSEIWGKKAATQAIEEKVQQRQEFMEGKKPKKTSEPKDYDVWSFDQF